MYKLTRRAADDFTDIYDYTWLNFGESQADSYTETLEAFFQTLASMPEMGRDYPALLNIKRIEFQQHSIFYAIRDSDILIVRILHQQMNHISHL